ncbi:MAG TPA: dihydrofolate reductase family protein [Longilinea sp.]|nr:dihydrofolate reductase family protein [Longilinea sp.]
MRKLIAFNLMTLDGFFEGPGHDIKWHNVDKEFDEFSIAQLESAGALLFGRVTYELMANFWPSEMALEDDPIVAKWMNSLPKVVFSRTLETAEWNNTRLVKTNVAGEITKLKQQPGKDLFLFGSADLAATLIKLGLIDEYRILLNPIVLGKGSPLFKGVEKPFKLSLVKTQTFQNGNILLYYQPDKK